MGREPWPAESGAGPGKRATASQLPAPTLGRCTEQHRQRPPLRYEEAGLGACAVRGQAVLHKRSVAGVGRLAARRAACGRAPSAAPQRPQPWSRTAESAGERVVEVDQVGQPADNSGAREHADVTEPGGTGDVRAGGRRIGVPCRAQQLLNSGRADRRGAVHRAAEAAVRDGAVNATLCPFDTATDRGMMEASTSSKIRPSLSQAPRQSARGLLPRLSAGNPAATAVRADRTSQTVGSTNLVPGVQLLEASSALSGGVLGHAWEATPRPPRATPRQALPGDRRVSPVPLGPGRAGGLHGGGHPAPRTPTGRQVQLMRVPAGKLQFAHFIASRVLEP